MVLDHYRAVQRKLGFEDAMNAAGMKIAASQSASWEMAKANEVVAAMITEHPELKGWMPEKGGIFYGADMTFFYNTFYKNPDGDWRYIVGFEPACVNDAPVWVPPACTKALRSPTIQS